jgi:hypothetical protein
MAICHGVTERTSMSPSPSHADPNPDQAAPPSRRSVLRGAAGVGAVGFAAAIGVGAVAAPALAAESRRSAAQTRSDSGQPEAAAGPLVVYLRDAASGELDVFAGTSHAVIRDPALVAWLTSAARPSLKRG